MDERGSEGLTEGLPEPRSTLTVEGPDGLWRAGPAAAALPRGTVVGRYLVLDVLGMGGMGVVYTGIDPDLGRKVAIKLLRPDRIRGETSRRRLLREAQAIARLTHPHVVAVYDVGTWGDQLFVAMELVEGQTLRAWLAAARRPWREVVERFLAAGRGLAAAHAAGLVHRDFKPDNVLLGDDGRVRVADFGLARPLHEAAADGEPAPEPSLASPLHAPLTDGGVLLGTPGYMAPEQRRGEAADARSDQFSFAVSLCEGLTGANPLAAGSDALSRLAAARLPARLKRAVRRGMADDPAARYPSLPALLADLSPVSATAHRRHLRWIFGLGLLVLAAAVYAGVRAQRERLCQGGEARLAGIWDEPRRREIERAFLATGVDYAAGSFAGVRALLDRYAAGWAALHRSACEATHVTGVQSEALLDRRMVCLEERRDELEALTELYARIDVPGVERAVAAAGDLTPLDTCSDLPLLLARTARPRDPARAARVEGLEKRLAESLVLDKLGREKEALTHLGNAAAEARAAGYKPLEADILYELSYLHERLGEPAVAEPLAWQAFTAALAGRDAEAAVEAASQLSLIASRGLNRAAEAARWDELAQNIAAGSGGGAQALSLVLLRSAARLDAAGRYAEAVATARRALALTEPGPGAEAPHVGLLLNNLAISLNNLGRFAEGEAAARRSLALQQKALGPTHLHAGEAHNTLGNAYWGQRRYDLAASHLRQALAVFEATYGASHPYTLGTRGNLGALLSDSGRRKEALVELRRVLAGFEAQPRPDPRNLAIALSQIGNLLLAEGRAEEARAAYARGLALDEQVLGEDHPDLSYNLQGQGEALVQLDQAWSAIPLLERAAHLRERHALSPGLQAESRFYLAKALERAEGPTARALRLGRLAREGFAAAGHAKRVAEVESWLAEAKGKRR